MRLGVDLDGTVADLHSALAREARRLFPDVDPGALPQSLAPTGLAPQTGDDDSSDPPFSMSALSSRQQRELWRGVCGQENFWESLDEIEEGALGRLYRLTSERRWEVLFVTSRPETKGDTAQMQSHRWLAARGFRSPSVFVVHGSRGKIASALQLDVLVDDRPENCLDVSIDSTARAILVWRGDDEKVIQSARQLGIGTVKSMADCLDILESLDRSDPAEGGVVDRLKRLLGLKSSGTRGGDRRGSSSGPAETGRDAVAAAR